MKAIRREGPRRPPEAAQAYTPATGPPVGGEGGFAGPPPEAAAFEGPSMGPLEALDKAAGAGGLTGPQANAGQHNGLPSHGRFPSQ